MDCAKKSLDIAIYSLTKAEMVKALVGTLKRGVTIRLITDQQEAVNKTHAQAMQMLPTAGIPIKQNTHPGLMQLKVTVSDTAVVTTGSYSYTANASTVNDKVLVVFQDPAMAQ